MIWRYQQTIFGGVIAILEGGAKPMKKELSAFDLRFGTSLYRNPAVLIHAAPEYVQMGKGTTGHLPVELLYGGVVTIKVGIQDSSGGTSWRMKVKWSDVHSIAFGENAVTIETTTPIEILSQRCSKGRYLGDIGGVVVGQNLLHVAHVTITFQSTNDLGTFKSGLQAMGTPGRDFGFGSVSSYVSG